MEKGDHLNGAHVVDYYWPFVGSMVGPLRKGQTGEALMFYLLLGWTYCWTNSRVITNAVTLVLCNCNWTIVCHLAVNSDDVCLWSPLQPVRTFWEFWCDHRNRNDHDPCPWRWYFDLSIPAVTSGKLLSTINCHCQVPGHVAEKRT